MNVFASKSHAVGNRYTFRSSYTRSVVLVPPIHIHTTNNEHSSGVNNGIWRPISISAADHDRIMKSLCEYIHHDAVTEYMNLMRHQTGLITHRIRQIQSMNRGRISQVQVLDQAIPRPEYFQKDRQRWKKRLQSLQNLYDGERRLAEQQQIIFRDEIQQYQDRIEQLHMQLHSIETLQDHEDRPLLYSLRTRSLENIQDDDHDDNDNRISDEHYSDSDNAMSNSVLDNNLESDQLHDNEIMSKTSSQQLPFNHVASLLKSSSISITHPERHASIKYLSGLRYNQMRLETELHKEAVRWSSEQSRLEEQVRRIHDRRKEELRVSIERYECELRSSCIAIDTYDRALDRELLDNEILSRHQKQLDHEYEHIQDQIDKCMELGRYHHQHQYQLERINRMLKARFGPFMIQLNHQLSILSSGSDRIQLVVLCPKCHHLLRQARFVMQSMAFQCDRCCPDSLLDHDSVRSDQLDNFLTRLDMLNVQIHSMRQMQRNLAARLF